MFMSPKEYIVAASRFTGSVLYYPGSGKDFGPITLFGNNAKLSMVVYCDYGIRKAEAEQFSSNIEGFVTGPIQELVPADFFAQNWDGFWPDNQEARAANPENAFGIKAKLSNNDGHQFDFIYLGPFSDCRRPESTLDR